MLSVMDVIISLKKVPLFANVHGEGLKRLSDSIRPKVISRGDLVFEQNDLGEEMYLVQSGRVVLYQLLANEEEHLEVVTPPGYFGDLALIDELPRSSSARAEEDSTLLVLHRENFRTAVQDYPDIAFAVFREFSRRVRRGEERIQSLSRELRLKKN